MALSVAVRDNPYASHRKDVDRAGHETRLKAITVRSLTEPGKYIDGRVLMLKAAPGRSRSWVVRVSIDGRRREIGLGSYPEVSLENARRKADAIRAMVAGARPHRRVQQGMCPHLWRTSRARPRAEGMTPRATGGSVMISRPTLTLPSTKGWIDSNWAWAMAACTNGGSVSSCRNLSQPFRHVNSSDGGGGT